MQAQAVEKFLSMVKSDKTLETSLREAMVSASSSEQAIEKAAALAQAQGFQISAADLKANLPKIAVPKPPSGELADSQLEGVSGGRFWNWAKETTGSTSIACYICAMGTSG
jgi:predicted ribosomally synthesized peptide with nif11-like leader